jgi:hypothetical protein
VTVSHDDEEQRQRNEHQDRDAGDEQNVEQGIDVAPELGLRRERRIRNVGRAGSESSGQRGSCAPAPAMSADHPTPSEVQVRCAPKRPGFRRGSYAGQEAKSRR